MDCNIKVTGPRGVFLFEGKISSDVEPGDLLHLKCFVDRELDAIISKETKEVMESFKDLHDIDVVAGNDFLGRTDFEGVLYVATNDGVLRKSSKVPLVLCKMMSLWTLPMEECLKVFQCDIVEELDINECASLTLVSNHASILKCLKKLKLNFLNHLEIVSFESMCYLQELRIEFCGISTLPESVGQLLHLEMLVLLGLDDLKSVPEAVGQMHNLQHLHIEGCNSLQSLPKSMHQLKRLKIMHLIDLDNVEICPQDVSVFRRLKVLCITNCGKLFPLQAFCQMLRDSVELRSLRLDLDVEHDGRESIIKALCDNGSIVESGKEKRVDDQTLLQRIFKRNKENHEKTLECVARLLAMKKKMQTLQNVPKEMVQMIANMLWMTRCDFEAWSSQK